jgi:predicted phage terminase large subunit-like protein
MNVASLDVARALAALRRSEFAFFLMKVFETLHPGAPPLELAWYIRAMCHALDEVRASRKRRLVITVPPRHLKSITASVAYVAWLLGHDPSKKIMVASYSQQLARLHSNQTRRILESAWYRSDFPGTRIIAGGNRALEFETTAGGFRKAVSVSGSTTGFGANLIILDDCMKADEARSAVIREETKNWFDDTMISRLNDKGSDPIISIQQRLHEDDLPAYLLEKGYEHLNLPAIAERVEDIPVGNGKVHHRQIGDLLDPKRETKAVLDQLRRDLGPAVFAAQYQQDPVAPEGNLIRMEWFGIYDEAPERHELLKVVQSWDTGMSADPRSDPSVCTTWGFERETNKWFLLDLLRERMDFPDLKQAVIRLHKRWQADKVLIEDAGSGKSLWQEFRATGTFRPLMMPVTHSKEERFTGCLAEVEAGRFVLPEVAPWIDQFRAELRAFPAGRHDDQVDSFSQFAGWQLRDWRWVITERDSTGRARRLVRERTRPF